MNIEKRMIDALNRCIEDGFRRIPDHVWDESKMKTESKLITTAVIARAKITSLWSIR